MATLVAEAVQGAVSRTISVPSGAAARIEIDMVSTVFPTNATLSFRLQVEESFDAGATWGQASGFPMTAVGGDGGTPTKGGGVSDGLPSVDYAFDGRGRQVRATATPFVGGTPGVVVTDIADPLLGLRPGSVPGSFDWGLTATVV